MELKDQIHVNFGRACTCLRKTGINSRHVDDLWDIACIQMGKGERERIFLFCLADDRVPTIERCHSEAYHHRPMGCFFIRKSPIRAVETGEMAESCDIARIGGYSRRNLQALYLEDDQRKRIRSGEKKG